MEKGKTIYKSQKYNNKAKQITICYQSKKEKQIVNQKQTTKKNVKPASHCENKPLKKPAIQPHIRKYKKKT